MPIARFAARAESGWYVEGDGWLLMPRGDLSISEAKRVCVVAAAALRQAAIA